MHYRFVLYLTIVTIVRATPIAQVETDEGDDISSLPSTSDSIIFNNAEYADCGSGASDHASSENVDESQSGDIFRRESACPAGVVMSPPPRIDPTQLKPAIKQKPKFSQESCAKYPDTKIGTCSGAEYGWMGDVRGFRYVLNCLDGKYSHFSFSFS